MRIFLGQSFLFPHFPLFVESSYVAKDIYDMIHSFKEDFSAFYGPCAKASKLNRGHCFLSWSQAGAFRRGKRINKYLK